MSEKFYLIRLNGGGDTFLTLVTQAVWDWIDNPYDSEESSYYEELPAEVVAEMIKYKSDTTKLLISRGSYDNDRAMAAPGQQFNSNKEFHQYLKVNNLFIEDEYEGYSY